MIPTGLEGGDILPAARATVNPPIRKKTDSLIALKAAARPLISLTESSPSARVGCAAVSEKVTAYLLLSDWFSRFFKGFSSIVGLHPWCVLYPAHGTRLWTRCDVASRLKKGIVWIFDEIRVKVGFARAYLRIYRILFDVQTLLARRGSGMWSR